MACAAVIPTRAADSESASNFYANKTITFVIGAGPGGDYDVNGRLLARHLGHHIPGNPTIVVQDMPGASSILAANYIFHVAAQDGSVLCAIENTVPLGKVLNQVQTDFDLRKLQWIGNMRNEISIIGAWYTSGVTSIDDAKKTELVMGATSPAALNALYPIVLNSVLGTKFRIVTGYRETPAIDLAMERGEVTGRAGVTWYGPQDKHLPWIKEGKFRVLVQVGISRAPDLPDIPLLVDLAKNDDERAILKLFSSPAAVGKPTVVGPGVPKARVAALRGAYDATLLDSDFRADASHMGVSVNPMSGDALASLVNEIVSTSDRIADRARAAVKK